jgi:hypothetical protein
MKIDTNLLSLVQILLKALGRGTLNGTKIIKSKSGKEYLFSQGRTFNIEPEHRLAKDRSDILENVLDCIDDNKDKVVFQISMAEFTKLTYFCETIKSTIKESNVSLILFLEDFSSCRLEKGVNPFKTWSLALGLSLSQHPTWPYMFLVDFEYRFHERSGRLSRYEEILKLDQIMDESHKNVWFFRMEADLVKRSFMNEIYLSEAVNDFNNFAEIYPSLFGSNSERGGIYCDETGIFVRRPYIVGISLESFLRSNSSKDAANLLIQTSCNFSKMKYFPNDLRPWNLIYNQNQCFFIDFPRNIHVDDDVSGIPNFISLLVVLDHIGEIDTQTFELTQSKLLYSVCNHAEIYNFNSFAKLESAWLNLQEYVDLLMLFEDGKMSVEMILNEVFSE